MFTRAAALNEACEACGLDLRGYDLNPRASGLLALLLGGSIAFLAVRLDMWLQPPLLLHLAWIPLIMAVVIAVFRSLKALSVTRGYVETGQ